MSECYAAPLPLTTGRHRLMGTLVPRASRRTAVVTVLARLGSLVTLAALLVLGGAVISLIDGAPAGHEVTVTVTFDGTGH
jgi:hypothetical protein